MTTNETSIMQVEIVDSAILGFTEKQVALIKVPTPPKFVKKRKGKGGREFDYVETNYVITMLNSLFGFRWDFEILWDVPFSEALKHGSVTVRGRLTAYDKEGKGLSKTQYGSQPIVYERDKPRDVEFIAMEVGDLYKSAASDCLKKCASLFGIALDVYSGEFSGNTDGLQTGPTKSYNSKPSGSYGYTQSYNESSGGGSVSGDDNHYRLSIKQQRMIFAIGNSIGVNESEIKELTNALYGLNSVAIYPSRQEFDGFLELLRAFPNKNDGGRDTFMTYLQSAQASAVENETEQQE